MITQLTIKNSKNLPLEWSEDLPFFEEHLNKPITFSENITLIVGPNGTGKSSLLKVLAHYFHCEQGGYSKLTNNSIRNLMGGSVLDQYYLDGVEFEHDGQVMFYSGDRQVGFIDGHFDDDFLSEAIAGLEGKSSGQETIQKLNYVLDKAHNVQTLKGRKRFEEQVNELWQKKATLALTVMDNPTLPKGKKTILLDEPDSNLDAFNQLKMLETIQQLSKNFQVIMTAHSAFAFLLDDVHVIETETGYYEKTKTKIQTLCK